MQAISLGSTKARTKHYATNWLTCATILQENARLTWLCYCRKGSHLFTFVTLGNSLPFSIYVPLQKKTIFQQKNPIWNWLFISLDSRTDLQFWCSSVAWGSTPVPCLRTSPAPCRPAQSPGTPDPPGCGSRNRCSCPWTGRLAGRDGRSIPWAAAAAHGPKSPYSGNGRTKHHGGLQR